ncbi:hypothetical protein Rhow_006877 [Rhodococcus wratislaviensis]|uniref:Uncharacterized protein n=1 Tax=Rhodococcus wratislaviensis TaxID=44752 RepID=A0A402CGK6_RHOWR|nr:hypothetical protein Rhow_006877 [Rhodococcus wratislaviensis]
MRETTVEAQRVMRQLRVVGGGRLRLPTVVRIEGMPVGV